jgi:hypothetical protein
MKHIIEKILPQNANKDYKGSKLAYWVFVALSITSMVRSCIHVLAEDGGAGTIAGLDLSAGSKNIIFAFGLWGLSQVIYAIIQLLVAFRYKTLIPIMYIILIFETLGRMFVGRSKPPVIFHQPPGGIANYIILPLAIIMLILSLRTSDK